MITSVLAWLGFIGIVVCAVWVALWMVFPFIVFSIREQILFIRKEMSAAATENLVRVHSILENVQQISSTLNLLVSLNRSIEITIDDDDNAVVRIPKHDVTHFPKVGELVIAKGHEVLIHDVEDETDAYIIRGPSKQSSRR